MLIKEVQASEEPILLWKNYKNTVIFYIEDDGVLALFPEDYGLSSEAWTILLLNFKYANAYDKQVKMFLTWYLVR